MATRGRRRRARPLRQRLRRTRACPAGPGSATASLAQSAQASFLRQLGWHDRARGWDGRALAVAGDDPEGRGDALIGLAADALGVGRFAASAEALGRAKGLLGDGPPRLAVRLAWVSAELAMATGDGAAAVAHASGRSNWRPRLARRATW